MKPPIKGIYESLKKSDLKLRETTTQKQDEFDAEVMKKRNDSVLNASLNYLDNHNVAFSMRAVSDCYSAWQNSAKTLDKQEVEEMDQEIKHLIQYLIELVKAEVKMCDTAEKRFSKLIREKKAQQKK